MDNVIRLSGVEKLTQVGIRDLAPVELQSIRTNPKIKTFFDWELKASSFEGRSWQEQCDQIVSTLGPRVYISFDIDGLDPKLCPHTGTPVPGGLEFFEVMHLFHRVVASGRKIVGADLVEVAPAPDRADEWDGNVGARVLFNLCMLVSLSRA
jgi:agmatinase